MLRRRPLTQPAIASPVTLVAVAAAEAEPWQEDAEASQKKDAEDSEADDCLIVWQGY